MKLCFGLDRVRLRSARIAAPEEPAAVIGVSVTGDQHSDLVFVDARKLRQPAELDSPRDNMVAIHEFAEVNVKGDIQALTHASQVAFRGGARRDLHAPIFSSWPTILILIKGLVRGRPGLQTQWGCDQVIADRLAAQLLSGPPAGSAVDVVERLLAVQGQDPRGARLAIRARSAGLRAADVDHALTVARSLIITWLNRGTLHLVRAEDYWWLHQLTTPQLFTGNARRLAQVGVPPSDAERAVAAIERALTTDGPLTRGQLRDRIAATGVQTQGQAIVHLLSLASLRGIVVRGPMIGNEHGYVLVRDWLGPPPRAARGYADRDAALAELARRYLAGHGPAADHDLAKWAGLPLRDARRGLTAIAAKLDQQVDGLVDLAGRPGTKVLPAPRLLGSFDPVLHGWASREPILGPHQEIITVNGMFRPFALADGKAVATWSMPHGRVAVCPFAPLDARVSAALEADAADVRRFLGA